MFIDVTLVFEEFLAQTLLGVCVRVLEARDTVDGVGGEMKAVEFVENRHVERSGDGAFFLVAVNVKISVVFAAIGEAMNERRITVISEDDGLVGGEHGIEVAVGNSVGMFAGGLERHEVNDINEADFDLW